MEGFWKFLREQMNKPLLAIIKWDSPEELELLLKYDLMRKQLENQSQKKGDFPDEKRIRCIQK